MRTEEVPIISDLSFEYLGERYRCSFAIRQDIESIIMEARASHRDSLIKLYDQSTLKPVKIRIYVDDKRAPVFGMVLYTINYKDSELQRNACGNYYPIWDNWLMPHPFQASICW